MLGGNEQQVLHKSLAMTPTVSTVRFFFDESSGSWRRIFGGSAEIVLQCVRWQRCAGQRYWVEGGTNGLPQDRAEIEAVSVDSVEAISVQAISVEAVSAEAVSVDTVSAVNHSESAVDMIQSDLGKALRCRFGRSAVSHRCVPHLQDYRPRRTAVLPLMALALLCRRQWVAMGTGNVESVV